MKPNDELAQFNGPAEVRIVRLLPGPIERVWAYLTDPEKRSRWFAGGPMEQRAGGKMRLLFQHKNLAPDETPPVEHACHHHQGEYMEGTVLRCEPPRVLAYTFGDAAESVVTFELSTEGNHVRLVLTHQARGEDRKHVTGYASGWHTHLAHLLAQLEGTPRPPFWPMHLSLRETYAQKLADQMRT